MVLVPNSSPSLVIDDWKSLYGATHHPKPYSVVRELLRCYEAKGDLELVDRTEQELRATLAKAFGQPREPERETVTLLNEIRTKLQPSKKRAA